MSTPGLLQKPDRLRSVFERIDCDDEGSDIAFALANNAMRAAGLRWVDMLDACLNPQGEAPAAFRKAFKPRQLYQGRDIPLEIFGGIKTEFSDTSCNGESLIISVETRDAVYGPIEVFDDLQIATIRSSPHRTFSLRIRRPRRDNDHPRVLRLEIA